MPTNRHFTSKAQSERVEFALQASYELEVVGRHLKSVVMSVLGGDDVLKTEEVQTLSEGF
ncbi:hypothetical protein [Delftia tsuruhatensis]|uniref:hypothetical protein n=1 Tax=Delftia tsuruhatensis TaxID=180282 RepID=UPI00209178F5|nr:hypothetical protein [Delftia tsuruhatensis]MCO5335851.1 hypothetical protein [Delftia tsuruhatensis]MCR4544178.1 hypothetical protein [Delftia tsuruhatensis]